MRLKLPKHIQDLNADILTGLGTVTLAADRQPKADDTKYIFLTLWHQLAPGYPDPIGEYKFMVDRNYQFDWCWPLEQGGGLVVEVDGGTHAPGGGRHAQDSDRAKLNFAVVHGWWVLRFSPDMLIQNPSLCIAQTCRLFDRLFDLIGVNDER